MIGKTYGQLTVLSVVEECAICQCDCGNRIRVWKNNLYGNTSSCGCIKRTQNGLSHQPEYDVWKNMIQRCESPQNRDYKNYGARGISVCKRWRSFLSFYTDMGARPQQGYTIERINNNGGYEKSNCRWAPRFEQNGNTRKNKLITFRGKTQHLAKWARECGLPVQTLINRIGRLGWAIDDALTKPRQKRKLMRERAA